MRHAEIIYGVTGQVLYLDPPDLVRASDPSVTVYPTGAGDDGPTEAATSGSASVDAVDTTLTDDVDAGSQDLPLDDVTDIVRGRRYLITNAAGLSEHVDVIGVGTTVRLQRPLVHDYASGAAFQGTRISIALDDTWVANRSKLTDTGDSSGYRARWVYTVAGLIQLAVTYFDLVRYPARSLVTGQDIDNRYPGWLDRLPPDHRENQGASMIDSAFEAIKLDALGDSQVIRRMRDTQILRELVIVKANVLAVENQVYAGSTNLDGLTAAREAYQQRYLQLVREPKAPTDNGGSGAATGPADRLAVWRR